MTIPLVGFIGESKVSRKKFGTWEDDSYKVMSFELVELSVDLELNELSVVYLAAMPSYSLQAPLSCTSSTKQLSLSNSRPRIFNNTFKTKVVNTVAILP